MPVQTFSQKYFEQNKTFKCQTKSQAFQVSQKDLEQNLTLNFFKQIFTFSSFTKSFRAKPGHTQTISQNNLEQNWLIQTLAKFNISNF